MLNKKYRIAKNKVTVFVLKEIDNGDFTEEEIAKMLIEVSLIYLGTSSKEEV
ncbi:hypothetical protein [Bacillus badius]|uniref:Uncharacterized protein n=1 Tax=Bacillus badius TaxID=1455 RepID=A0ABR5B166_BACBA|nr:hypothetical protein [Bacillus badius]KIL80714.1 hypothetical protein SD77_0562 [Bacillus badius]MED4715358.1 hypothetical protein [Bacillus badius]